jgi:dienelactone hydrolase
MKASRGATFVSGGGWLRGGWLWSVVLLAIGWGSGLGAVRGEERVEERGEEPTGRPSVVRFAPVLPEATEGVPSRFQLGPHEFTYRMTRRPAGWGGLVPSWDVAFPSPLVTEHACNNEVSCEYFEPQGEGRHPGVVVLHILGGDFELSRLCCRTLASNGVGALFLKMPYYGPRRPAEGKVRMISVDPEQTVAGMTQAVLDIRRAAAWLAAREEIDPQRIGITGISLGGIVGALAAAAEPRFQNVCLVLAGGDLYRILSESDETAEVRQHWANRSFDEAYVRGLIAQIDPLTHAHRLRGRRILMFNASQDEVVPPACTEALWRKVGEPEIHWWEAGHYTAIWHLPKALMQMTQFFQESKPTGEAAAAAAASPSTTKQPLAQPPAAEPAGKSNP